MMRKRWWFFIGVIVLLTACGGKKNQPVDMMPKPTHIVLEVTASGDINPNQDGRPSPVVLRFYELKSLSEFNRADFLSLYEKDKTVLGGNLVGKREVIIAPDEKKTIHFEASNETRAVGAFAAFRNYENARWRVAVPVRPNETTVLPVTVHGNALQMP